MASMVVRNQGPCDAGLRPRPWGPGGCVQAFLVSPGLGQGQGPEAEGLTTGGKT